MKSFTKKLCIVNVIFYLFYPRGAPPNTPGTPPPWGGTLRPFWKIDPRIRVGRTNTGGSLPPGRSSGNPPPGGSEGGGVKSRKTLGISTKTCQDPSLLSMFSVFLIPFSEYPPPTSLLGLEGGGKRAPSVPKIYFYTCRI